MEFRLVCSRGSKRSICRQGEGSRGGGEAELGHRCAAGSRKWGPPGLLALTPHSAPPCA